MTMYEQALPIFTPIFGMTINVVIQILGFRIKSNLSLLHTIYLGFLSGLITMIVLDLAIQAHYKNSFHYFVGIFITNIIIYGSLGYCYFNFNNLGETARRIRLLREIYDSEDGLTPLELNKLYSGKEVIAHRMARLLNNKQVILINDKYLIGNPTVLCIANIIIFLKFMVIGKKSEFD
ncbi:MAG: hypothetical protein WBV23_11915 [Desulfobaccales bacterium]